MDIVSYSVGAKAKKWIKKFIAQPDSDSGVVTMPTTIETGETITIPTGRQAVMSELTIDGDLTIDGVLEISGSTKDVYSKAESDVLLDEKLDLTGGVMTGLTKLQSNVRIVDFGTVAVDNRYVEPNPFGATAATAAGCLTEVQILDGADWVGTGWIYYQSLNSFGIKSHSVEEGIVVQTAIDRLNANTNFIGSTKGSNVTSAQCRVIVFYIGDAT